MITIFCFILFIAACSEINHLGGQSEAIPSPRITCRVFGISAIFALLMFILHIEPVVIEKSIAVSLGGLAFWETFKWGPGFMCLPGNGLADARAYTTKWWFPHYWICKLTDMIGGTKPTDVLGQAALQEWGFIYMTLRGGMLYPLFAGFGVFLTPWAFLIGLIGFSQGIFYRYSLDVRTAEYKFGALLGLALSSVLVFYIANF